MPRWTKEELENMLEDVVNELDLSDGMIEKHGPLGTPPAILVREVMAQKDREIKMLKQGFVSVEQSRMTCGDEPPSSRMEEEFVSMLEGMGAKIVTVEAEGGIRPMTKEEAAEVEE